MAFKTRDVEIYFNYIVLSFGFTALIIFCTVCVKCFRNIWKLFNRKEDLTLWDRRELVRAEIDPLLRVGGDMDRCLVISEDEAFSVSQPFFDRSETSRARRHPKSNPIPIPPGRQEIRRQQPIDDRKIVDPLPDVDDMDRCVYVTADGLISGSQPISDSFEERVRPPLPDSIPIHLRGLRVRTTNPMGYRKKAKALPIALDGDSPKAATGFDSDSPKAATGFDSDSPKAATGFDSDSPKAATSFDWQSPTYSRDADSESSEKRLYDYSSKTTPDSNESPIVVRTVIHASPHGRGSYPSDAATGSNLRYLTYKDVEDSQASQERIYDCETPIDDKTVVDKSPHGLDTANGSDLRIRTNQPKDDGSESETSPY